MSVSSLICKDTCCFFDVMTYVGLAVDPRVQRLMEEILKGREVKLSISQINKKSF